MSNYTKEFEDMAKKMGLGADALAKALPVGATTMKWSGKTIQVYAKAEATATAPSATATATATAPKATAPVAGGKLSEAEFAIRAIRKLRAEYDVTKPVLGADGKPMVDDKGKTLRVPTGEKRMPKGINARMGFNGAWKAYFGTDPVAGVARLVAEGKLYGRPCRGGYMLYESKADMGNDRQIPDVLGKILAD
jgi:hypothetical protein